MLFSAVVKDEAFERSGGRCECRRVEHAHKSGRCHHGVTRYGAQYHAIEAGETVTAGLPGNCRVLCAFCRVREAV